MPSARTRERKDSPDVPPRRVSLEERLAWLERHVTEQDKAMLALHEELARLRTELKKHHEHPAAGSENGPADSDERPPHY